jgi:hypothetical protein
LESLGLTFFLDKKSDKKIKSERTTKRKPIFANSFWRAIITKSIGTYSMACKSMVAINGDIGFNFSLNFFCFTS